MAVKLSLRKLTLFRDYPLSFARVGFVKRKMTDKVDIAGMRKAYKGEGEVFDIGQLTSKEPYANFGEWFKEACNTPSIHEANAMSLATATKDGCPSVRIVLLKGFDSRGFMFFTNYTSKKAQDITENPRVSLCFNWDVLNRVVRIEGTAEKLSEEESTAYFQSRPKSSQIGACVSHQSKVIPSRQVLDDRNKSLQEKFSSVEMLPKPDYWGGYLIRPHRVEFWQGQTNRIHDRICFRRPAEEEVIDPLVTHHGDDGWVIERLSP